VTPRWIFTLLLLCSPFTRRSRSSFWQFALRIPSEFFPSVSDSLRCMRRCSEDCLGNTQIRRHHEPATHGAAGGGAVCALISLALRPKTNGRELPYCRHKSIIAYLASANLPQSSAALREELGDSVTVDDSTLKKYEGLLEKKWTSVVRLQKKVGSLLAKAPRGIGIQELICGNRLWIWNHDAPLSKLNLTPQPPLLFLEETRIRHPGCLAPLHATTLSRTGNR
jgi:hypothetical protein